MAIFNSFLYVYQRVTITFFGKCHICLAQAALRPPHWSQEREALGPVAPVAVGVLAKNGPIGWAIGSLRTELQETIVLNLKYMGIVTIVMK